jgi:hypothetical protein
LGVGSFIERKLQEAKTRREAARVEQRATYSHKEEVRKKAQEDYFKGYEKGERVKAAKRGYADATRDNSFAGKAGRVGGGLRSAGDYMFGGFGPAPKGRNGGGSGGDSTDFFGSPSLGLDFSGGSRRSSKPKAKTTRIVSDGKTITIKENAPNSEEVKRKRFDPFEDVPGW